MYEGLIHKVRKQKMSDRVFYSLMMLFVAVCLGIMAYTMQKQSITQQICESKGGVLMKSTDGYSCVHRGVLL